MSRRSRFRCRRAGAIMARRGRNEWALVAILIDERGSRRRTTLGRFARRADAARHMGEVYNGLPKKRKPKG